MASRDTITISSEEEDNDVEIVLVTKRRNRKRQKISDGALTRTEPENKDKRSSNAALPVPGSSAIAKIPARARSADIPTSILKPLPVLGRPSSAPLDHKRAIHVPTSLQQGLPDRSFSSSDARPSTPIRQSSSHLSCPANANPEQAYPTPKTIPSSFRRRRFEDFTSNSFVAPVRGELALGAREKDLASLERNRQPTPEVVRAIGLEDPFNLATRKRVLGSGLGVTCQVSRKNGRSMEEAPSHVGEVSVKTLPQGTLASSIQSAEGAENNLNTNQAADKANGESYPSDRPRKRKLHSVYVESTVPQPRIRNRILWSIPAYQEPKNDRSGPPPLKSTTELAETRDSPRESASTISQEPRTQNPQKAWSCKMYADLAQQLQESFPFADFARKYSRSEHEVFDLFSAVVHLPLLQKSSTGLSRVSPQGHQSVKTYRTLIKETKIALAKEGKKEEKEPKKATASLKSTAENQVSRTEVVKTPSKDLLDTAVRAKSKVDAR